MRSCPQQRHHDLIVTMEENVISGGMGEQVMRFIEEHNLSVESALPSRFRMSTWNMAMWRFCAGEVGIDVETITERKP